MSDNIICDRIWIRWGSVGLLCFYMNPVSNLSRKSILYPFAII